VTRRYIWQGGENQGTNHGVGVIVKSRGGVIEAEVRGGTLGEAKQMEKKSGLTPYCQGREGKGGGKKKKREQGEQWGGV